MFYRNVLKLFAMSISCHWCLQRSWTSHNLPSKFSTFFINSYMNWKKMLFCPPNDWNYRSFLWFRLCSWRKRNWIKHKKMSFEKVEVRTIEQKIFFFFLRILHRRTSTFIIIKFILSLGNNVNAILQYSKSLSFPGREKWPYYFCMKTTFQAKKKKDNHTLSHFVS